MKWQDVARIPQGTIPKEQSIPILQVESLSESLNTMGGELVPKPSFQIWILKLHLDGQSWKQSTHLNGQLHYPNVNAVI